MRVSTLILLPLLAATAAAQDASPELRPRWMPTKSLERAMTFGERSRTVVLKVVDDAGARARDGRLEADALALRDLVELLEVFSDVEVRPLSALPVETLRELRAEGQARSREQLADMTQYFLLEAGESVPLEDLMAALLTMNVVEEAFVHPPAAPPPGDVLPTTPSFTSLQTYRGPAPIGIDADFAGAFVSGTGSGVTLIDVEGDWTIEHEDLSTITESDVLIETPTGFSPSVYDGWAEHGTAVLGILAADADASGVTGLATGADVKVAYGINIVASSLLEVLPFVGPGDVVLIEAQTYAPNWDPSNPDEQFGLVPVEYYSHTFNAIRLLTANGVHVVQAAGNGSQDLDSTVAPFGDPTYDVFDRSVRDSGSILVSAGNSGATKFRLLRSNFGDRVDAFSWGENVVTTGREFPELLPCDLFPGSPGPEQDYTSCFGGTSAASAIVAGAVAILEATHESEHSMPWSPLAMRGAIRTIGTPNTDPGMGRQPDLKGLIERNAAGALLNLYHLAPDLVGNLFPLPFYDVDGDGNREWLLGMFEETPPGIEPAAPGMAMMFNGASGEAMFQWSGQFKGDDFGAFLLTDDDWNLDGVQDVWVSAPGGKGSLTLFDGQDGNEEWHIDGDTDGERFGEVLCNVGDRNGDLIPDLAVSAPLGDGDDAGSGRVLILSAADGSTLEELKGTEQGERFGASLVYLPGFDPNFGDAIAVGVPGDGVGIAKIAIIALDGGFLLDEIGGPPGYGDTMVRAPDLDGDGVDDLFIGAPGASSGKGEVFQLSVKNGIDLGGIFEDARREEEEIPARLALTPDYDGGGLPDLLVGSPNSDVRTNDAGTIYVVSSETGDVITQYFGVYAGGRFGSGLCGGDFDGDGVGDVLGCAFDQEGPNENAGGAYMFISAPSAPPVVAPPPTIASLTPSVVPAVVPDAPALVTVSGTGLDATLRVAVDGEDLTDEQFEIVGSTVELRMPLVSKLGAVDVEIETLGGTTSTAIDVVASSPPALQVVRRSDPGVLLSAATVDSLQDGIDITTGSSPGDLAYLFVSVFLSPTTIPGIYDLDIGNNLANLKLVQTKLVPPRGWTQLSVPVVPDLGGPVTLHFQSAVLELATLSLPLVESNVQSVQID